MSPLKSFGKFRSSFRFKLFLIFTLLTGLISAAFVFLLVTGEIRNYKERTNEKAKLLAAHLARTITLPLYAENLPELTRMAKEMAVTPNVAGIIISNSDNRKLVDIKTNDTRVPAASLVMATAPVMTASSSPAAEAALFGIPQTPPSRLGSVAIAIDASELTQVIHSAIFKTGGLALLFWLTMLATCYPALKRITGSFNTLTDGLNSMRTGNFATEIIIDSNDEAGRAAQAINGLAAALGEREIENRRLQEELVNSMRLEAQEERQKIMAKLIQTNRMTSLGLLISSIAHNINTPNGVIKLSAQHLARSWKEALPILEAATVDEGDFTLGGFSFGKAKEEIRGAYESILSNANRVERVIQDLRTYNLGERNELSPGVSVNQIVEEALTIIRAHSQQGEISLTHNLAANMPGITGNQCQLEQVVVNLLLNALQAMPNKQGVVNIRTEFSTDADEVRIVVTDQGAGISPEVRKHLCEAFFTTRIDKGGSGLGLYISNFIVTEHNGRLTIDSELGSGTVATVHLPASVPVQR
jgi:signal transduction histidine kinase